MVKAYHEILLEYERKKDFKAKENFQKEFTDLLIMLLNKKIEDNHPDVL